MNTSWRDDAMLRDGSGVAAARAAEADRHVVADEPATAVGEDGRSLGPTRPVLLATAGGRAADTEPVRSDPAAADGTVGASRVTEALVGAHAVGHGAGVETVSEKSAANASISGVRRLGRTRTGFRGGTTRKGRTKNRWPGSSNGRSSGTKTEISEN